MRERRKKRNKGNDYFLGGETVGKEPFTISQPIRKKKVYTIGKLGNGILRPKNRTLGQQLESKDISPNYQDSLVQLTNKDSTAKLAEQIATSIQNRIDEAALKKDAENPITEEVSKKSPVIIGTMIVGGLIVTGILIYVFKKAKKPTLKTA